MFYVKATNYEDNETYDWPRPYPSREAALVDIGMNISEGGQEYTRLVSPERVTLTSRGTLIVSYTIEEKKKPGPEYAYDRTNMA